MKCEWLMDPSTLSGTLTYNLEYKRHKFMTILYRLFFSPLILFLFNNIVSCRFFYNLPKWSKLIARHLNL